MASTCGPCGAQLLLSQVWAEMNGRHSCAQIVGSALTLDCFAMIACMIIGWFKLLLWLPGGKVEYWSKKEGWRLE